MRAIGACIDLKCYTAGSRISVQCVQRDLCLKKVAIGFCEQHDDAGIVHEGKKYVTELDQLVLVSLVHQTGQC